MSLEIWQYNDPLAALGWVCERLRQGDRSFTAWLDLAETLTAASQPDAAAKALTALDTMAAAQPDGAVRLELARFGLERNRGRMAAASQHAERAISLLGVVNAPHADLLARALLARSAASRALNKPGALALAAASTQAAEAALDRAGLRGSWRMGDVFNERALIAYARDDLPATVRWAERELALIRKLSGPDAPAQLDALATLGAVTSTQRDYVRAVRHLQEGRRIGRLAPAARRTAYLGILNSLSPVLSELGQPQEALAVADEALGLAQTGWGLGSPNTLTPLERRGGALEYLHRYVDARRTYAELLAVLQRQGAQVAVVRRVRILDTVASFLSRMDDVDGAQQLVDQGLMLVSDQDSLAYWRGRMLRRAALLASAQGQAARAEQLHDAAQPLLAAALGAGNPYLTVTHGLRCSMQLRSRIEPKACDEVAAGLPRMVDGAPLFRVTSRLALGAYAQHQARPADQLDHLLLAMAAAQSDRSQGLDWQPLAQLAIHQRNSGRRAEAVALGKAAIERIEALRAQFVAAADLSAAYLAERQAVYRQLADWLAEDQRVDEAVVVLQLLKGEEYRGFVQSRSNAPAPGTGRVPWTAAELLWIKRTPLQPAQDVRAPIQPPRRAGTQSRAAIPTMRDIVLQEQTRVSGWRSALQRPLLAGTGGAPGAALAATPKPPAVAGGTLLATVFLGPQHVNFMLQSGAAHSLVRLPIDAPGVSRDLGQLLAKLEQRDAVLPLLQSLYARLAAPIDDAAKRSGARRLVLRLDGELRYLPYAALHDGSGHLVERYTIEQQVLGTAPAPRRSLPPGPGNARVQAFGSTLAAAGLPALPGVAAEICGVVDGPIDAGSNASPCARGLNTSTGRGTMPGRAWLDEAFTAQQLRQALATPWPGKLNLLHIGAHFVLRPGEVGRSWLQAGQQQKLQLDELMAWSWSAQDLVTLSACQTGLGGGGEVEGLSTLLISRGAGAVIASLWRVEDRSTAELMRSLYRHLHAGNDAATALRRAQLESLAQGNAAAADGRAHAFHWAGFFLTQAAP